MNQPDTVVFDLDGTLIHSAPDLHAAANVALAALDRGPLDLPTVVSFIGKGVENLVERCLQATGGMTPQIYRETLALYLETYARNKTTLTRPYPGVVALLERLHESGVPLGICTNKPTQPARDICDALDLTRFFGVIRGAEPDLPKKPDPSPLLRCITDLSGTIRTTLYVGDSAIDYRAAKNANVPFRLFTGGYLNHKLPEVSASDRFDDWTKAGILTVTA